MRFLDFNSVDHISNDDRISSREDEKVFPGPGIGHLPSEGALPEEDRYGGPQNDLSGGDLGRGPGHMIKDVTDFQKGTGTGGNSKFKSQTNYIPPRSVPR